jgi:enolase-phosphatase E1
LPEPVIGLQAVLLDIEGTTTPIAFVRDVLFPFARARLPDLLRTRAGDPAVAAELAAVRDAAPGQAPLAALLGWMDADAKATPLKALQGLLWREGYESGALRGAMYPDVAPCLRRWREHGLRLFVYSSGSAEAQRLIFGHSSDGDLSGLFEGHFDTRVGPKREAASYGAITGSIGLPPDAVLFLSDVEAELDAAAAAGLATAQLVRAADGTVASDRHAVAATFPDVERRFGL